MFGYEPLATFTAFLAIATIILAIATILLACIARRQWKDGRTVQRAYLNILPAGIDPYTSNTAKLACDFFIYNAGNLPATKVSWITKRCLRVEDDFDPCPFSKFQRNPAISSPRN